MSPSVKRESHALENLMRSCAFILAIALSAQLTPFLSAQTNPPPAPAASQSHRAQYHGAVRRRAVKAAKPSPEPAPPPAPPAPNWPINDQPKAASITWDSSGLKIDAANSSLRQILSDVATTTGMKVEGLGNDERVYGDYGPGSASDVLSDLLKGTGYNFLMMGQQAPGTPLQIVLSARNMTAPTASHPPTASQNDTDEDSSDNEIDDRLQPPQFQPGLRQGFTPGGPPRTPQQVMEEMQQRQQQMQQQQLPQNPQDNNQGVPLQNQPPQPNQPN
ncbi:MAG TPA: hypothetical protein VKR52_19185 [Terracidiphilus sp.]|nr:hypothetical protein [Terracidiphilus sp.]